MAKKKVGVLISGNGSNLQALLDACVHADYPAEIAVVISNKESAFGLQRAADAGVVTHVVPLKAFGSRELFDAEVDRVLCAHGVEIVCLAGYMRLLSEWFVTRWCDRLLNIHPSLLPAFKGVHAQEDALNAGVRFSGCTVHFVRAEMDVGPIIIQAVVPVLPSDTAEALKARILQHEHQCYPLALRWLAEGRLVIRDEKVLLKNSRFGEQALISPLRD